MNSLKTVADVIQNEKDFIIGSHVGPDGDSLGSSLALAHTIKMLGKKVSISIGEDYVNIPPQYRFMPDVDWFRSYKQLRPADVFISLECPQMSRLGASSGLAEKARVLVNIDHHIDNKEYGNINYVNKETSSTCEILYNLFELLDIKMNRKLATYLYVGIVTDTGRFQYSNTGPKTFEVATKLLETGAKPNTVFQHIYENKSLNSLKLLGMILSRSTVFSNGFIYSTVDKDDLILAGIQMGETEDFIDYLRAGRGVKVAAILKELKNGQIKVSLRSRNDINVAKISEVFGGGGHEAAAGFSSSETMANTVRKLCEEVKKYL